MAETDFSSDEFREAREELFRQGTELTSSAPARLWLQAVTALLGARKLLAFEAIMNFLESPPIVEGEHAADLVSLVFENRDGPQLYEALMLLRRALALRTSEFQDGHEIETLRFVAMKLIKEKGVSWVLDKLGIAEASQEQFKNAVVEQAKAVMRRKESEGKKGDSR